MTARSRYVLIQIPGWILAAIILYALHRWMALPLWVAGILLAAGLAKDALLFPYLRRAYETDEKTGAHRLIGQRAEVHQRLAPDGYVLIRGELWRARLNPPGKTAEPGASVHVTAAAGLVLLVAPEE